jgi:hypothetical protein
LLSKKILDKEKPIKSGQQQRQADIGRRFEWETA